MDFTTGIVLLASLGVTFLGALILLCYLNRKWFYFREKNGMMLIMRGKALPFGKEIYIPDDRDLKKAFEPVLIPPYAEYNDMKFEDKNEMERVFFDLLFKWAKKFLYTDQPDQIYSGLNYIERLKLLKLTVNEYQKLAGIRSIIVFKEGANNLEKAYKNLLKARENFEECLSNGCKYYMSAEKNIEIITNVVDLIEKKVVSNQVSESSDIPNTFTPKILGG